MVKIGLIDSGVNLEELDLPADRVKGVHLYRDAKGRIQSGPDIQDRLGHGTACAWAMLRYDPEVCFYVVKIFDGEPASDEGILIAAIRRCLEQEVAIINISLGIQSTRISEALFDLCNEAYAQNIPIIAAAHLDDKACFPAYHPKVTGVGCLDMESPIELVYIENAPVAFYTKGEIIFQGRQYFGTSFACPQITGQMLQLMQAMPGYTIPALEAALAAKASRDQLPFALNTPQLPDAVLQSGLQEKYFQPLAKFQDIEKVLVLPLEDPIMRAISANHLVGHGHLQYIHRAHGYHPYHIPALVEAALYDAFDTIALGSLRSLLSYYYYRPLCLQLQELLQLGKHFIVYHEADYQLLEELRQQVQSRSRIILSTLDKTCIPDFNQFAWLPSLQTPVLAVIGAGAQEVISIQESICRRLREMDYMVSYISPVIQGELIGAVFSYPVAASRGLHNDDEGEIAFLEQLLRAVQAYYSPDLILTGLPGALVPGKQGGAVSGPSVFLKGIQPDALMIVVREEDTLEAVMNNYYASIGITGARRCCFFLVGKPTSERLHDMETSLMPLGIVIFSGGGECDAALDSAIRSFFSLQALPGLV